MKKSTPPSVPPRDEAPWARLVRDGWGPFAWYITVGYGLRQWGTGFAWTERGARCKAERKLAAMKRQLARRREIRLP